MHHAIHVHRENLVSRGRACAANTSAITVMMPIRNLTHTIHYSRHVVVNLTMVIELI